MRPSCARFARRLRAIRFPGTAAYLQDLDELAHALLRRADEIGAAPSARPAARRAPEHARLIMHRTRVVGPSGAVAMVAMRRKRAAR